MSYEQGYNPLNAADPTPPKFTNIGRVKENRLTTIGEAMKDAPNGVPEGVDPAAPFWQLIIESLDSRWPDGGTVFIFRGSKLFDKNGKPLDNTQRPAMVAAAFRSYLGVIVYPGDPNYDESKVVGQAFRFDMVQRENDPGLRVPVVDGPDSHLGGPEYVFTGKIRIIQASGSGNAVEGAPGTATPVTVDLATDEAAQAKLREALGGIDLTNEEAVTAALKLAGLMAATINGSGLTGHIVNGTLAEALAPFLTPVQA